VRLGLMRAELRGRYFAERVGDRYAYERIAAG
jgi:hypothetical protein